MGSRSEAQFEQAASGTDLGDMVRSDLNDVVSIPSQTLVANDDACRTDLAEHGAAASQSNAGNTISDVKIKKSPELVDNTPSPSRSQRCRTPSKSVLKEEQK